jgi:hypothetical protein
MKILKYINETSNRDNDMMFNMERVIRLDKRDYSGIYEIQGLFEEIGSQVLFRNNHKPSRDEVYDKLLLWLESTATMNFNTWLKCLEEMENETDKATE